jgi:hypothetical protein
MERFQAVTAASRKCNIATRQSSALILQELQPIMVTQTAVIRLGLQHTAIAVFLLAWNVVERVTAPPEGAPPGTTIMPRTSRRNGDAERAAIRARLVAACWTDHCPGCPGSRFRSIVTR